MIPTCFKAINLISRSPSSKWMFRQLSFRKISCAEHFNCGRFELSKLNLMFTNLKRSKIQVGGLIEVGKLIWVVWNLLLWVLIDSWSLSQVKYSHFTLNSPSTVCTWNITSIRVVYIARNTIFSIDSDDSNSNSIETHVYIILLIFSKPKIINLTEMKEYLNVQQGFYKCGTQLIKPQTFLKKLEFSWLWIYIDFMLADKKQIIISLESALWLASIDEISYLMLDT